MANVDSSNDYIDDYTTTNLDSNTIECELVKYIYLIQDKIRKVPYSSQCLDLYALLYITNNISLFRILLVSIRPRAILVGGSQLFANKKGIAKLKVKGSSSILISNILYILKLGVNLLSTKRLYSKGLTFTSDENYIVF